MIKIKLVYEQWAIQTSRVFYLEMSEESSVRDHDLKKVLLPLSLHHVNNDIDMVNGDTDDFNNNWR